VHLLHAQYMSHHNHFELQNWFTLYKLKKDISENQKRDMHSGCHKGELMPILVLNSFSFSSKFLFRINCKSIALDNIRWNLLKHVQH